MFLSTILHFETFLTKESPQTLNFLTTLKCFSEIIFYFLMSAENKKYFQKQK